MCLKLFCLVESGKLKKKMIYCSLLTSVVFLWVDCSPEFIYLSMGNLGLGACLINHSWRHTVYFSRAGVTLSLEECLNFLCKSMQICMWKVRAWVQCVHGTFLKACRRASQSKLVESKVTHSNVLQRCIQLLRKQLSLVLYNIQHIFNSTTQKRAARWCSG